MTAALHAVAVTAVLGGAFAASVYAIVRTLADAPGVADVLSVLFKED